MKVRDKIKRLRQKYDHISAHKFLYNRKTELNQKSNKITCFFLVNTRKRGVFVMRFVFSRAERLSVKQWGEYFERARKGRKALLRIMKEDVLPNISLSFPRGDDWQLVELIGWALSK